MFNNVGKKIKTLTLVVFWIEVVLFAISGLAIISIEEELFPLGILVIAIGFLVSWLSGFVLYGYGEIIDNLQIQTTQLSNILAKSGAQPATQPQTLTWKCASCGKENDLSANFCEACGRAK